MAYTPLLNRRLAEGHHRRQLPEWLDAVAQIWRHTCQALIWCFFIFGVFTGVQACWHCTAGAAKRFMAHCSAVIVIRAGVTGVAGMSQHRVLNDRLVSQVSGPQTLNLAFGPAGCVFVTNRAYYQV